MSCNRARYSLKGALRADLQPRVHIDQPIARMVEFVHSGQPEVADKGPLREAFLAGKTATSCPNQSGCSPKPNGFVICS